jgi:hydroxymethylbilane synthase
MNTLIIASRKSKLALWQSNYIKNKLLQLLNIDMHIDILELTTKGDESQISNIALSKIGGKSLFTKELEDAMLNGNAHLAVHSLKDMPMELPCINGQNFILAAVLPREDARDAFISHKYNSLAALPKNAIIGTSSLRRTSILKHLYPYLDIRILRGNVDTRLNKLNNNEYDAIILASAGLKRLNLAHYIKEYIAEDIMLPAPCQGSLGIEIYTNTYLPFVEALNHIPSYWVASAERTVSKTLGGSCQVPLSAYAYWVDKDILCLEAWVLSKDGRQCIKSKKTSLIHTQNDAENLGYVIAQDLMHQGALDILSSI